MARLLCTNVNKILGLTHTLSIEVVETIFPLEVHMHISPNYTKLRSEAEIRLTTFVV